MQAFKDGKFDSAKVHFIDAAEVMERRVAASPTEEIRRGRKEMLSELIEIAKACDAMPKIDSADTNPLAKLQNLPSSKLSYVKQAGDGPSELLKSMIYKNQHSSFSDVIGHVEAKEQIFQRMVNPFTHPDLAEECGVKAGGNVLLYGPPGTGKTELAAAAAAQVEANFYVVKSSDLLSKWYSESEKNIRQMFEDLAAANQPAIVFLDDGAGMLALGENDSTGVQDKVLSEFLTGLDGLRHREGGKIAPLCFIVATNTPWVISPSMLSRLGGAQIYMGLPNAEEREKILQLKLVNRNLDDDVDLKEVARLTDGYCGRDLHQIVENAKRATLQRSIDMGGDTARPICQETLIKQLQIVKATSGPENIRRFEEFGRRQL